MVYLLLCQCAAVAVPVGPFPVHFIFIFGMTFARLIGSNINKVVWCCSRETYLSGRNCDLQKTCVDRNLNCLYFVYRVRVKPVIWGGGYCRSV
jgi:hypothetical protein